MIRRDVIVCEYVRIRNVMCMQDHPQTLRMTSGKLAGADRTESKSSKVRFKRRTDDKTTIQTRVNQMEWLSSLEGHQFAADLAAMNSTQLNSVLRGQDHGTASWIPTSSPTIILTWSSFFHATHPPFSPLFFSAKKPPNRPINCTNPILPAPSTSSSLIQPGNFPLILSPSNRASTITMAA